MRLLTAMIRALSVTNRENGSFAVAGGTHGIGASHTAWRGGRMRLPGSVTNRWLIVAAVVQCACLALPMVPVLRRHRWLYSTWPGVPLRTLPALGAPLLIFAVWRVVREPASARESVRLIDTVLSTGREWL